MYSPQVLDHFEHPRNAGELPGADADVTVENPVCGDVLQLMLRVEQGRVAEARFKAQGCVATMACASLLTELIQGRATEGLKTFERQELVDGLGGLSNETMHASHLAVEALRAALRKVQ
jgi:nitrogen fixation protein NifU and related proteins